MAKDIPVARVDTNPAINSIKKLRDELKKYKNEMANLDEDSDAFSNLAAKAGDLKHQIDEINQRVKGSSSDWGDMVGNVSKVAAGITGAFQAVAGGLQAMGMESEALDKTIARMQGLMAVTQGLSSIDGAVDGFNDLTAAMGTAGAKLKSFVTGLGKIAAPIAIVTALFVAFKKLKSAIDGTSTALKNRKTEQDKFNASLQKELEIRKKAGFTEEENILFEISQLEIRNQKLNEHNAALKAENDQVTKNAEASRNAASMYGTVANQAAYQGVQQAANVNVGANTALMAENTEEINKNAEALAKLREELEIITEARALAAKRAQAIVVDDNTLKPSGGGGGGSTDDPNQQALDAIDIEIEAIKRKYNIESKEFSKNVETQKSYYNDLLEQEKKRLELLKEQPLAYAKQLTVIKNLETTIAEIGIETESTTETIDEELEKLKQLANSWKEAIQTPQEKYNQELANLNELKNAKLLTDEEYVRAKKQLDQELADWEKDLNQKLADDKKEKMQATLQVTAAGFNAIGSIMSELANNENAETKESFEKQKKLQIGAATMSMLTGIINAWTSAMALPSPWNFIQAGIDTAATAALGAIQINKIKQQQFGGTGSTPGTSSAATAAMIVPPVQYSNAVQGANTEGAIRDSKVYVTETDIKNTMNKVSVQEHENVY